MIGLARALRDWILVCAGAIAFSLTGRTPARAYQAFVGLFCRTGGRSNDAMSALIARLSPPYPFPHAAGVLGELSGEEVSEVAARLREDGYYVFPQRIAGALCDRLVQFALSQPSIIMHDDAPTTHAGARVRFADERAAPRGVRYDFEMGEVVANPDVQALLCDLSILSVAQAYLRARPRADVLALWWSTAVNAAPSKAAAQHFHFDLDRVKWLKFFIYLTDVDERGGPHTFIAGSHRTGGIPPDLLRQGYARLSEDEVRTCYAGERFIEFAAPRGTVIAEDTRGLHKGRRVERGDRLMLQLQFSNSLFGAHYPKAMLPRRAIDDMQDAIRAYRTIYQGFLP